MSASEDPKSPEDSEHVQEEAVEVAEEAADEAAPSEAEESSQVGPEAPAGDSGKEAEGPGAAESPNGEDSPGDEDESSEETDDDASDDPSADADDEEPPVPGDDTPEKPGLEKAPPVPLDPEHLKSVLESVIFVADRPITEKKLARIARARIAEIRAPLGKLMAEYEGRGIELVQVGGGYQFRSATKNAPFVRTYVAPKPVRLSRAQLEALSIVAYRQPVTRPEIDEIRGVDSGSALKVLADRGLLKILGRKDEPGRPLLYGTSPEFLEFFGLNSLKDLPTLQEFAELSDESRALFERRMGEPLDLKDIAEQASQAEAAAQAELFDQDDDDLDNDDSDDEKDESPEDADEEGSSEESLVPEDDSDDEDDDSDDEDDDPDDEDDDSDDEDDDPDDEEH